MQRSVVNTVRNLGIHVIEEKIMHQTIYSVDIFFIHQGHEVIIEVDGPSHFIQTMNGNYMPSGSKRLKHKHLKQENCRIISIPFYEWSSCKSQQDKSNYIENILNKIPTLSKQ